MKIRTDYVTNSSSSSYCMYGVWSFKVRAALREQLMQTLAADGLEDQELDDAMEDADIDSAVVRILKEANINDVEITYHESEGEMVIGVAPGDFDDKLTGKEMKAKIKAALVAIFKVLNIKETPEPSWLSGEIYDN